MERKPKVARKITRRGILPILGGILLFPFIGSNQTLSEQIPDDSNEEEYETLLKPDGTVVKVKINTVKRAKVLKKNISNKTFLNWLGKKF